MHPWEGQTGRGEKVQRGLRSHHHDGSLVPRDYRPYEQAAPLLRFPIGDQNQAHPRNEASQEVPVGNTTSGHDRRYGCCLASNSVDRDYATPHQ
jgi:hypothetical protein